MPRPRKRAAWYVYLARCADDTLYCGITNDLAARLAAHANGTGARYTRGRGPLELIYQRTCRDRSHAQRVEYQIKQLTRVEKLALVRVRRSTRRRGRSTR